MKVIIIGLGSIGRRHIENIKRLYPDFNIAVLRQHSKDVNVGEIKECIEEIFFNLEDALNWKADAVFITNPSPLHIETAMHFIKANCHLFMEKPIADTLEGVDSLIDECNQRKLVCLVGYCLRFLTPLQKIKEAIDQERIGSILSVRATVGSYLPGWRPQNDYRKNVSAKKELGGGVLLELSHEVDLVQWLVGDVIEVGALIDKVSALEIDVEDIVEINLRFKNNAIGNIHLDMLDHSLNRSCRVIGSEGTLIWNAFPKASAKLYLKGKDCEETLWEEETTDRNQALDDEIIHFFDCVKNGNKPLITAEDGKRTLEIILAAKESSEKGEKVKI